jgi:hypothetical protein
MMDFIYQIFNLFVFASFIFIAILFVLMVRKPLAVIPSFFTGVAIYIATYNGLIAGLVTFLLAVLFQVK